MSMSDAEAAIRLVIAQQDRSAWFWKPQWHWFGWATLLPFKIGHDEYARRTLILGWAITGRMILPLWDCGDATCHLEAMAQIREEQTDDHR